MEEYTTIAYKGFDYNLSCRGFQYEVGKEYEIESECKRIARARGWVIWKNVPDGCKGIPDTSLLSPSGEFIMVEFKRDNKAHIRPEQIVWQKRFHDKVFIISSVQEFENLLIRHDETPKE